MTEADLNVLLEEGECTTLEYKEGLSASFAREMVALANTIGGKILLGVRDDGVVTGVRDSNTLRSRIQDIARNCDPSVTVQVEPVGDVLAIHVRESDSKPVQCSDGFFWRQGAVTQKLSRDEIRDFFRAEGAIRFDLAPCPRFIYPDDFDREKFDAWVRVSGISGRSRVEDVLVNIDAAERRMANFCSETPEYSFLPRTCVAFSPRPISRACWRGGPRRSTSWTARTSMAEL